MATFNVYIWRMLKLGSITIADIADFKQEWDKNSPLSTTGVYLMVEMEPNIGDRVRELDLAANQPCPINGRDYQYIARRLNVATGNTIVSAFLWRVLLIDDINEDELKNINNDVKSFKSVANLNSDNSIKIAVDPQILLIAQTTVTKTISQDQPLPVSSPITGTSYGLIAIRDGKGNPPGSNSL